MYHLGFYGDTIAAVFSVPAPTPTPVPTATPIPTPTVTPTPVPLVGVSVAPAATPGVLGTTLTARGPGCSPPNQLQALNFTGLDNARVTVNLVPPVLVTAPRTVPLPGGPPSVGLSVERVTPGRASTAHITVVDGCGLWPTFVGGGATAY